MNNFQEIPYYERSLFIAKLYNHAWYDSDRFAILENLLKEWDENPPREVKFLNEIEDTININDIIK
jgi:hypothetical protein